MVGERVRAVPAALSDKGEIVRLLAGYLREMAGDPPDARRRYPYLDLYWTETGRQAFLIEVGQRIAGFALVNAWAPSGRAVDRAMAEFFVGPDHRRAGVGTRAAVGIIQSLPGSWEIGMAAANDTAQRFWRHAIAQMPDADAEWSQGDGRRWSGPIVRFRNATPA